MKKLYLATRNAIFSSEETDEGKLNLEADQWLREEAGNFSGLSQKDDSITVTLITKINQVPETFLSTLVWGRRRRC